MTLTRAKKIVALIVSALPIGAAVVAVVDRLEVRPVLLYEQKPIVALLDDLERWRNIMVWKRLNDRKESGDTLSLDEFAEWCEAGRRFGWIASCN